MKALVTGASGFIGSTLIEYLNQRGVEVHALMRRTSSSAYLDHLKFTRVEGDLSQVEGLKKAVAGMDYIFHLAGSTAAPNRNSFFESNAHGTARLAQAVAESNSGLKRFIHVSSLAAAGPALDLTPKTEQDREEPVSFYGESKLEGEKELLKFKDRFPIVIVRPPMVYGPRDKGVFVVIRTLAKSNLMPLLPGGRPDGQKYYSSIHVADLCQGIIQAGFVPTEKVPSGEIFYLSSDGVHSYQDLLMTMAKNLGKKPWKLWVPKFAVVTLAAGMTGIGKFTRKTYPLNLDKVNEILPDYWICSNEKAKKLLGFQPQYDLATGMADAVKWYRQNRWL